MSKRGWDVMSGGPVGIRKSRALASGRVITYTKAIPVVGSYRYRNRRLNRVGARYGGVRSAVKGAIAPSGGRPELKYVDTASALYGVNTTGSVTCLNLIAVGDDNTTRDGRQVTIKSVQLHGMIFPEDNTTSNIKGRVMLVWDNANNSGAIATIAQILTAADGVAFPLIDNANRFTILVDRTFAVGKVDNTATQAFASSPTTFDVEIYKLINCVTQYSGTTAAIGSIQNGALLLVTVGSGAAGAAATLNAATRVRFTDD